MQSGQLMLHSISVFPLPCTDQCFCFYSVDGEANSMNCSFSNMTQFPDEILPRTQQLIMTGNNLEMFYLPYNKSDILYLKTMDLVNNSIRGFDEASFKALLLSGISLKLSGNNLKEIPAKIADFNLTADIWLGRNPYECHCDMMWMRDWLQNASHVMDRDEIKCGPGKYQGMQTAITLFVCLLILCKCNQHLTAVFFAQIPSRLKMFALKFTGIPIVKMNRKSMGCMNFPLWIGITIGSVAIAVIVVIIVANRKWEAIKLFLFMRFNVTVNDDPPEDVDDLEFDAFVTYR